MWVAMALAEQGSFLSQRKIGDCAAGIPPFVLQHTTLGSAANVEADAQEAAVNLDEPHVSPATISEVPAATALRDTTNAPANAFDATSSAISTTSSVFASFPPPLCRHNRSLASVWYSRAAKVVR